ncbi:RNA methyltransferase [Cellulomonas sp. JZ18]|uniref:RNA methyltransferase n=1 Tax=Cellulomonas sp. JZ18 TaxID=2654191 RepID=UPI001E5FB333|nr:RNA methyltransferase [Cellulomonas sp. JZ18]
MLAAEVGEALPGARGLRDVPGRDDALELRLPGALAPVARLRTAVAAWVVVHLDVPRPRSITSPEHLQRVVDAVYASLRVAGSSTFRFEAAGSDSAAFRRLGELLHEATGLRHEPEHGDLVLRVRRGPRTGEAPDVDPGWDVLVRVGPRPLSARTWRVADFPGAANATIAAAMARLAGVHDDDRVLNLMCGSGTLLAERLLAGPAAAALGVDLAEPALDAARANLEAAGLLGRASRTSLVRGDATDADAVGAAVAAHLAVGDRPAAADVVLADPPWGTLHGSHAASPALHADLLRVAHAVSAPGARLVVLTHEVKVMERVVRDAADLWRPVSVTRVFAKGHHPRVHVLRRV